MKSISDVCKKVKHTYKNLEIELNKKGEYLIIRRNNLKIEADLDRVDLFKNNKEITHFHPKDYDDLYRCISLFLDDADSIKRKVKKAELNRGIIIAISIVIFSFLFSIFEHSNNFFIVLGLVVVLVASFGVVIMLIKSLRRKYLLKKIDKDDLDLIKSYELCQKDWGLALDYNVLLDFEDIDFICIDFLDMKKNIFLLKGNIFDKEFENIVKSSYDKNLTKWYNQAKKVINCIYKYYDKDGKRKI